MAAANQLRLLPQLFTPVRAWSITLSLQDAAVGVEEGDMALLAETLAEKASVMVCTFLFWRLLCMITYVYVLFFEIGCQLAPIRAVRQRM